MPDRTVWRGDRVVWTNDRSVWLPASVISIIDRPIWPHDRLISNAVCPVWNGCWTVPGVNLAEPRTANRELMKRWRNSDMFFANFNPC